MLKQNLKLGVQGCLLIQTIPDPNFTNKDLQCKCSGCQYSSLSTFLKSSIQDEIRPSGAAKHDHMVVSDD
jgi:hypothetical protein